MKNRQKCKSCNFFCPDLSTETIGECRRYPPAMFPEEMTVGNIRTQIASKVLPTVSSVHWCGEWRKAEYSDLRPKDYIDQSITAPVASMINQAAESK